MAQGGFVGKPHWRDHLKTSEMIDPGHWIVTSGDPAVARICERCPHPVVLLTLAGSRAYGTDRPDSDSDYRGVFVPPTEHLFRLRCVPESWTVSEPDVSIYELAKFCSLAARGNPTVLETLWGPVAAANRDGTTLLAHREAFLSRKVFQTYGGYAMQQLRKAQAGTGGSRGSAHLRREKFKLHILRLMEAGIHVLRTGEVLVRVEDPERLRAEAAGSMEAMERRFIVLNEELHLALAESPLPEEPDYARIDSVLRTIRNMNHGGMHG